MTELQVVAIQQITAGLAAFHRDHMLIKSKQVKLDADDRYDIAAVEIQLKVTDSQLRQMCMAAGNSNLTGVPRQ
jgi:hypothetical protein